MHDMRLLGVRGQASGAGPVAVLVQAGGSELLAVPVTAREGLELRAGSRGTGGSWADLVAAAARALGGTVVSAGIDTDEDARLTARLVVAAADGTRSVIACQPGQAVLLSVRLGTPLTASESAMRLRGVGLAESPAASAAAAVVDLRRALDDLDGIGDAAPGGPPAA